jgi:multisubunit Na+/H+ antiporter MnhE subunit
MNLYHVHGAMQFLAFGILFPIGAIIAMLRYKIGPNWLKWHLIMQLLGVACVTVAIIAVQVAHHNTEQKEKVDNPHKKKHRVLGSIVVSLVLVQVIWAFFGKRLVPWNIWLLIHFFLAVGIIGGGWTNIYLAWRMRRV